MTAALALAFGAGTVATVNPCGFALLPAYLVRRLAAGENERSRPTAVGYALLVGVATTAGFTVVFAVVGSAISLGARFLTTVLPWAGLAIGVMLAAAGVAVLMGKRVGVRLPMQGRRASGGLRNDLMFGIGYGTASLSCALPVFLAATGTGLTGGLATSVLAFVAYAAGMGTILTALAVAAALANNGLARALRRSLPYVERVSGALLLAAGAYVVYYWAFALRFGSASRAPIDGGAGVSSRLGGWLGSTGGQALAGLLLAVLSAIALWALRRRLMTRAPWSGRRPAAWPVARASVVLLVLAALGGAALALADSRGSYRLDRNDLRGFVDSAVPAPGFALRDQDGRAASLADFRGRPVVIAFLYSQCREICRVTAPRIRATQRLLGAESGKVAWLAISVDPRADTAASVRAFSSRYGLADRWRYLFKPSGRVLGVLKAYGIQPQLTAESSAQAPYRQHSAYVTVLDGRGWRVESFTDSSLASGDLAHDLRMLLASAGLGPPPSAAAEVRTASPGPTGRAGRVRTVAMRPDAHVRDGVVLLRGTDLAGSLVDVAAFTGKPVVINFWASWCAGCAAEAPALAQFARTHPEARVIGVDVEDTQSAARGFVRRFDVSYPSIFDPAAASASPLGLKGLPTTIFLDRRHREVTRIVGESDRAGFEAGLRAAESR